MVYDLRRRSTQASLASTSSSSSSMSDSAVLHRRNSGGARSQHTGKHVGSFGGGASRRSYQQHQRGLSSQTAVTAAAVAAASSARSASASAAGMGGSRPAPRVAAQVLAGNLYQPELRARRGQSGDQRQAPPTVLLEPTTALEVERALMSTQGGGLASQATTAPCDVPLTRARSVLSPATAASAASAAAGGGPGFSTSRGPSPQPDQPAAPTGEPGATDEQLKAPEFGARMVRQGVGAQPGHWTPIFQAGRCVYRMPSPGRGTAVGLLGEVVKAAPLVAATAAAAMSQSAPASPQPVRVDAIAAADPSCANAGVGAVGDTAEVATPADSASRWVVASSG